MKKNRFLMIPMLLALSAWLAAMSGGQAARAGAHLETQETALSASPDWIYDVVNVDLDANGYYLGGATSAAGDINGDGFADVIIGAEKYEVLEYRGGAAMLFYGGLGGLSSGYNWIAGGVQGSLFGSAVSGAGNVNGDAYDDIIVGAYKYKAGDEMPEAGAVYVFHGNGGGPGSVADWQYVSDQREAWLGSSVSAAGDVNGDTFADIIVGAPLYGDRTVITETVSYGAAFVFYGSANGLPDQPDWTALGGRVGAQMGRSVSGAGDVNGDGFSDVLVGAPDYAGIGRAYVFHGGDEGENGGLAQTPAWTMQGPYSGSRYGWAVSGAGDVNGDGFDDVIVSAPGITSTLGTQEVKGAALVYLGSLDGLSTKPAVTLYSDQALGLYGYSVAGGGDVNNDGYDDVLVSAPMYTYDQPEEGAIFLYYGSPLGVSVFPGFRAYGEKAYAELGRGLDIAGDVKQDGFADMIAGAPLYKKDTDPLGRAMAWYGDDSGDAGVTYLFLPLVVRTP